MALVAAQGLAERASLSEWVTARPGLVDAVREWDRVLAHERATLPVHATRLARPGPIPPLRAMRHSAAFTAAQFGWLVRKLPGDLADGWRPVRQPVPWLQETVGYVVRDHLALLGPTAAELARIIEESEGFAPDLLVTQLRQRPVQATPLAREAVSHVVEGALGDEVRQVGAMVSTTPITQLHAAELKDGTPVLLRVRRPGVDRAVRQDARIVATMMAPIEWAVRPVRDAHPLGVVELAARQLLEETDLRNEALNAVELGLVIEQLGIEGMAPLRPLPGLVTPIAAAFEALDGAVPLAEGLDRLDRPAATAALVGLTLESALAQGIFHADLGPDQLAALPDGRLALIGCSTIGRLDGRIRRAALDYFMALMVNDAPGQVAAMQASGAVPDDVDVDALIADLQALELPDPMAILAGGDLALGAVVRDGIALLVRHRLRPPLELLLFLRAVLSLRALLNLINPGQGLVPALLPMLPRLPEMLADLA